MCISIFGALSYEGRWANPPFKSVT